MTTDKDGLATARGEQTTGIAQGPLQRVGALGIGDIVAMAMRTDGDVGADGVVGALHEVRGTEHYLTLLLYLCEQGLSILPTAKRRAGDDDIRTVNACLTQGLQ